MAKKYNNNSWDYDNSQAKVCGCRDSSGIPKNLYTNIAEAKNAQEYAQRVHSRQTEIYKCPNCKGYHIKSVK